MYEQTNNCWYPSCFVVVQDQLVMDLQLHKMGDTVAAQLQVEQHVPKAGRVRILARELVLGSRQCQLGLLPIDLGFESCPDGPTP